jgi:hypothetical protein
VVVAVIAAAPSVGRVGAWGVQPQVVVAVIAVLLPHACLARPRGIPKSNAMVTERYITCITVSRHEPYGQVARQAGTSPSG